MSIKIGQRTSQGVQEAFYCLAEAVGVNDIVAAEDLTAAKPITCALAGQPDVPRNIKIKITDADVGISAFSIVVTGVDAKGVTRTETFTFAGGLTQTGSVCFATITSVVVSSMTGAGALDTLDVGRGSKLGLANAIIVAGDVIKVQKNAANYPAASYTVNVANSSVDVSTGGAITNADWFIVWYRSLLGAV